jgi:hypothetical protein
LPQELGRKLSRIEIKARQYFIGDDWRVSDDVNIRGCYCYGLEFVAVQSVNFYGNALDMDIDMGMVGV